MQDINQSEHDTLRGGAMAELVSESTVSPTELKHPPWNCLQLEVPTEAGALLGGRSRFDKGAATDEHLEDMVAQMSCTNHRPLRAARVRGRRWSNQTTHTQLCSGPATQMSLGLPP